MDTLKFSGARRRKVAVIGSGISGLSAAWLLSKTTDVVLYESENRPGGHANTVDAGSTRDTIAVDTGFIVYNDRNYPNLVALFDHLNVPTEASNMSFAASLDGGGFEYSGSGIGGLLGQRSNIVNPRFWKMLSGIRRFYAEAPELAARGDLGGMTLGEYCDQAEYGRSFIEDHLLPMGAAIWSTTITDMRDYPMEAFIRFFVNHGLVVVKGRPQWRTVKGGSREYVSRLLADFAGEVRLGCSVIEVRREADHVMVTDTKAGVDIFDDVVIATHADQALAMLADADLTESKLLGAFRYTANTAVLHSDATLMPQRKQVWASWNFIGDSGMNSEQPLCVTYWMNKLQNLENAPPMFLTLNPNREIASEKILARFEYTHPLFDQPAIRAQKDLWQLQKRRNTWFCGAHFGSGFHEDGLQSGLAVAEQLGGMKRPWNVENESGRIVVPDHLVAAE